MRSNKNIRVLCAAVTIIASTLCAANAYAQSKTKNSTYIRLAHITDNKQSITLSDMLSDSLVLVCVPAGEWAITHMSITFQPEDGDYMGPYPVNGPKLPAAQVVMLQQLKEQKIKRVKVFVSEIMVLDKDKQTRTGNPITYYIMN